MRTRKGGRRIQGAPAPAPILNKPDRWIYQRTLAPAAPGPPVGATPPSPGIFSPGTTAVDWPVSPNGSSPELVQPAIKISETIKQRTDLRNFISGKLIAPGVAAS